MRARLEQFLGTLRSLNRSCVPQTCSNGVDNGQWRCLRLSFSQTLKFWGLNCELKVSNGIMTAIQRRNNEAVTS